MRFSALRSLVLVALTLALFGCGADDGPPPPPPLPDALQLYIRDLAFDPLAGALPVEAQLLVEAENGYAVVQYESGRGEDVHLAVREAGGRIYGPLARHGLLVGGLGLGDLEAIDGVRFAGVMHPGYKLDAALRASAAQAVSEDRLDLAVSVFENAAATAEAITELGGAARVVETADGREVLVVEIPGDQLARLAALADVRHVEPTYVPFPLLDVAPGHIGVRANDAPPWRNIYGLDGTDQVLGVYDTGVDNGVTATLVADLQSRVVGDIADWTNPTLPASWADRSYNGDPFFHGTFVTDAAVGDGASSGGLLTGVAPAATAIVRPFTADSNGLDPGYLDIGLALNHAFEAGARIHNDSWGPATGTAPDLDPILNQYSQQGSAAIDAFVVANPTMLVVTAAGNSGPDASTISTLSCSKNSLVVGNSGNGDPPSGEVPGEVYDGVDIDQVEDSSSRGPSPGGRLKPDVVAPGQMVAMRCPQALITANDCPSADFPPYDGQADYAYADGTSFSAPLVSGAALLLRELVTDDINRPGATGMLIKAMLVNGAEQLLNDAPDNDQGWGLISLRRSIDGPGAGTVMFYDSLSEPGAAFSFTQTGQSVVFENVTFAAATQLAITLSWYDIPGVGATGVLINDLDLTLALPDGTTVYQGGVPSMQNGQTVANGPADRRNNTEKLILARTPAGASTITVTATFIFPAARQPFALAVSSVDRQDAAATTALRRLRVDRGTAAQ